MTGPGRDDPFGHGNFDPVPENLVKGAREAFNQRAAGPTASLISDSLIDGSDPAGDHRLTFQGGAMRVEVRVKSEASESTLTGTVSVTRDGSAAIHLEGSELALAAHMESGAFSLPPVPHGVVRMSFEFDDGSALWTDWFQV